MLGSKSLLALRARSATRQVEITGISVVTLKLSYRLRAVGGLFGVLRALGGFFRVLRGLGGLFRVLRALGAFSWVLRALGSVEKT